LAQLPSNYVSGISYSGINFFLLGLACYKSPYWLTFKQIQAQGGSIRKGEKASIIVYFTFIDKVKKMIDEKGNELINVDSFPMLKYYHVWNWDQTDGLPKKVPVFIDNDKISECEKIIENMKLKPVVKPGLKACYRPAYDYIMIPSLNSFDSSEDYYSTFFHELTHWTGHLTRLNREGIKNIAFGSECHSKEELVAEMGASFLSGITGISQKVFNNNAAYIQSWLEVLKNDKRFVISAAAQAEKDRGNIYIDYDLF